jgi:hypothetical protein
VKLLFEGLAFALVIGVLFFVFKFVYIGLQASTGVNNYILIALTLYLAGLFMALIGEVGKK